MSRPLAVSLAAVLALSMGAVACDQASETVQNAKEGGFCGVWQNQRQTILDAATKSGEGAFKAAGTALGLASKVAPEDVREPLRIISEELNEAADSGEGVDPRVLNGAADQIDKYCADR